MGVKLAVSTVAERPLDDDTVEPLGGDRHTCVRLRKLDHEEAVVALEAERLGLEAPGIEGDLSELVAAGEGEQDLGDAEDGVVALQDFDVGDAQVFGDGDYCGGGAGAADIDRRPDGLAVLDVVLGEAGAPGSGWGAMRPRRPR